MIDGIPGARISGRIAPAPKSPFLRRKIELKIDLKMDFQIAPVADEPVLVFNRVRSISQCEQLRLREARQLAPAECDLRWEVRRRWLLLLRLLRSRRTVRIVLLRPLSCALCLGFPLLMSLLVLLLA